LNVIAFAGSPRSWLLRIWRLPDLSVTGPVNVLFRVWVRLTIEPLPLTLRPAGAGQAGGDDELPAPPPRLMPLAPGVRLPE
jgi:hypothetical protein